MTLLASVVDQVNDEFAASHIYDDGGIYTITVRVSDEDGGVSLESTATAVVQGVGLVDGTRYIIGTDGRDHVKLKFNEKKDEPEQIVGDEAQAVAEYIYNAFYSPIAQARSKAPRVELSRLTVRQYQNTIADLIGSFTGANRCDQQRGLNAEYFNAKNFQRDKRAIERVDATVDLDFGESIAHGFGHEIETFGNPNFCGDEPLTGLS
ncbi:MAG: hypothetical protein O3C40_27180 [Planctomycetota bacterium]|nr:hypothetical protein [Planctomycetota bacterium]